jgi:hypothetical protein
MNEVYNLGAFYIRTMQQYLILQAPDLGLPMVYENIFQIEQLIHSKQHVLSSEPASCHC